MGNERGLPPIPRGVGTELANYLRALHELVSRLSGLVRGTEGSRALRASDGSATTGTATASIGQGSVLTRHLADKVVTGSKLADGCITEEKLAVSAVTDKALLAGAVTEAALAPASVTNTKLADNSVTEEKLAANAVSERALLAGAVTEAALAPASVTRAKLADGVLPVSVAGVAVDGEVVTLPGVWTVVPLVALTAFALPHPQEGGETAVPSSQDEERAEAPLTIGVSGLHEIVDDAGQGTGIWEFTAVGDFTWTAIGYTR